jgi:ADP-heptose:LPS heptosyltransferase
MEAQLQGKKILCVRLDNMGDLIMSTPAIAAIKRSLHATVTILTSSAAQAITPYIPGIDHVIVADVPWVKMPDYGKPATDGSLLTLVERLKHEAFDAAVIFTVYSQNPLPAAMVCYMAGIPIRMAYCRENPYGLLTHWLPDPEPYAFIRHQVLRDIELVRQLGIVCDDDRLNVKVPAEAAFLLHQKLIQHGVDPAKAIVILHPGVSETKRRYPEQHWITIGKELRDRYPDHQFLITGSAAEADLADAIRQGIGERAFCMAGILALPEFMEAIRQAMLIISVNTSTIHIAAALQRPVIVLYAMTNPQHTPWKTKGEVLPFKVPASLQSKNPVIEFVTRQYGSSTIPAMVLPEEVIQRRNR